MPVRIKVKSAAEFKGAVEKSSGDKGALCCPFREERCTVCGVECKPYKV
ncbi:MAG: hypothetical protein SCALA701_20750 [Candidatus Scalindua sp.]|nr:hypothetical protein [Planctomycetota bacterium]GJQ59274.1 MAG: hypothetical protein SCALA701_20750 [Candidatus Scalindua sp.]